VSGRTEGIAGASLRDTDDQYRKLIERIPVVTYTAEFGARSRWLFVSPQIEVMLGYTPDEWRSDPDLWFERIHPEDRARVLSAEEQSRETLIPFSCDYRMIARNGRETWVRDKAVVRLDEGTGAHLMEGILLDITEQKHAEEALAEAEERFRQAFSNAPIGLALVSPDGRFLQVNQALCDIVGHSREQLLTKTFQDITHPDDLEADLEYVRQVLDGELRRYQLEKRYLHGSGRTVWINLSVSLVRDSKSKPRYFISQIEDITERKETQKRLEYLADHDPLTGLFNRRRFDEELARQVAYSDRYGSTAAVLLLDLDNFKEVNDTLGHGTGDELLKGVVELLEGRLRKTDVVARLGGDEFAILLAEADEEQARRLAEELVVAIREHPFVALGEEVRTTASIGVAPIDGGRVSTPAGLLMDADLAMYEAKATGRDRCAVRLRRAAHAGHPWD
jgi:diguanylate cyclase (GGDEF)-like protein/PAS domain S-box-containing protein